MSASRAQGRSAAGMSADAPMGVVDVTSARSAATPAAATAAQRGEPPTSGYDLRVLLVVVLRVDERGGRHLCNKWRRSEKITGGGVEEE